MRPDLLGLHLGHQELWQGEITGQPLDLGGREGVPLEAELARFFHGREETGIDVHARPPPPGPIVQALGLGVGGVDDHRAQLHAGLVLQGEGRLDGLAHRHFLGEGDQDHPAAGGVGEELDDLGGLRAQGAAPGRIDEPAGRGEKGDGVAGCGRIDNDQVGDPLPFQLLDLAQDEHVADAGNGG